MQNKATPSRRRRVFKWTIARGDRVIADFIRLKQMTLDKPDAPPPPGTILTFPIGDGRLGACRVAKLVERDEPSSDWHGQCAVVALTPYLGKGKPKLSNSILKQTFVKSHHSWKNDPVYWLVASAPDSSFTEIGVIAPVESDRHLGETRFGFWYSVRDITQLLMQEEWDNGDPEEILAREREAKLQEFEEKKRKQQERASRLGDMSLAKFRRTKFFAPWETHMRPKLVVTKTRSLFRDTIDVLASLGDKPKRRDILKEVKQLILGLNAIQQQYQCFETVERDDICDALADLCMVLKIKDDPALLFEKWEDM